MCSRGGGLRAAVTPRDKGGIPACPFATKRYRQVVFAQATAAQEPAAAPSSSNGSRRQVRLVWTLPSNPASPSRSAPQHGGQRPEDQVRWLQQQLHQPQPGGADAPAARPPPQQHTAASLEAAKELMRCIKAARSWERLQVLFQDRGERMNHMHLSAVVTHLAQLRASSSGRADNQQRAERAPTHQTPSHSQQQYNPLRSSLPPLLPPPQPTLPEFLTQLEAAVLIQLGAFEARQLANTLWAVARLSTLQIGYSPHPRFVTSLVDALGQQLPSCEPQHLSNALYALQQLGYMPSAEWLQAYFSAVEHCYKLMAPGEVAQLMYACGKLAVRPPRWLLSGLMLHSQSNMSQYKLQELAMLLHGVAHVGATFNDEWMRELRLQVVHRLLASGVLCLTPDGCSAYAAGLPPVPLSQPLRPGGRLHCGMVGETNAAAAAHDGCTCSSSGEADDAAAQRQGLQHAAESIAQGAAADALRGGQQWPGRATDTPEVAAAMYPGCIAGMLLVMGKMQFAPPGTFLELLLHAAVALLPHFGSYSLSNLLLGLAYLRFRPRPAMLRPIWLHAMSSLEVFSPQHYANVFWSVGVRLRVRPPRAHVEALLRMSMRQLSQFSGQELVCVLQGVAAMGGAAMKRDWLELCIAQVYQQLPSMGPVEVVYVLDSMAQMGHKPPRMWMAACFEALQPHLARMPLVLLVAALYAAARLGFRPNSAWRSAFMGVALERMIAGLRRARSDWARMLAGRKAQRGGARSPRPAAAEPWTGSRGDGDAGDDMVLGVRTVRQQARASERVGLSGLPPDTLAQLLWAVALLDMQPREGWLRAALACVRVQLDDLDAHALSNIVWALARLGHNPGPEWMAHFMQRVAATSSSDCAPAAAAARDAGAVDANAAAARDGRALLRGAEGAAGETARGAMDGAAAAAVAAELHHSTDAAVSDIVSVMPATSRSGRDEAVRSERQATVVPAEPASLSLNAEAVQGAGAANWVVASPGPEVDFSPFILEGLAVWATRQLRTSTGQPSSGSARARLAAAV